jgi:Ankyrin repeat
MANLLPVVVLLNGGYTAFPFARCSCSLFVVLLDDAVLFESHSIIHGRPIPLNGRYFAHIFAHFEPLGFPVNRTDDAPLQPNTQRDVGGSGGSVELPPYILSGSIWESEYYSLFPEGWSFMKHVFDAIQRGDLSALKSLIQLDPSKVHATDGTAVEWQPIHEAARSGQTAILRVLIEEHGVNVNERCFLDGDPTPLSLAHTYLGPDHESSLYLASIEGALLDPLESDDLEEYDEDSEEEHDQLWDADDVDGVAVDSAVFVNEVLRCSLLTLFSSLLNRSNSTAGSSAEVWSLENEEDESNVLVDKD